MWTTTMPKGLMVMNIAELLDRVHREHVVHQTSGLDFFHLAVMVTWILMIQL